ncbi:MAG: transcription antitermination factor NusB [Treponema sp.]|nr:transcription antitermination factor NusB [Treponema sp.]
MVSRRKGRILAFQALFSWDLHYRESKGKDTSIPDGLLDFSWNIDDSGTAQVLSDEEAVFSRLLVIGTVENIAGIDKTIQKHLKNWNIERLNRVDLAVLRMSAYTLMYQRDIPASVVIDEAICISKEFGTDDSYRFVNGVLDGILKSLVPSAEATEGDSAKTSP